MRSGARVPTQGRVLRQGCARLVENACCRKHREPSPLSVWSMPPLWLNTGLMAEESAPEDLPFTRPRLVTPPRIVKAAAARQVSRGLPRPGWRDAYHVLLTMPLAAFLGVMAGAFLAINALFATLYLLVPAGIAGARPGSYADA